VPSKTDIYDSLHQKLWWLKMSPAEKCLWYYFITGYRGLSGIWIVTLEEASFRTSVPIDETRRIVAERGLHGIRYDEELAIVFNKRRTFYKLRQGGKPEQNANSIKSDYMATYKAREFWREWFDIYQNDERVSGNIYIMDFFHSLKIGEEPTRAMAPVKPILELESETIQEPEPQTDDEREVRIQYLLDHYTAAIDLDEIDEEDRDLIFEVYKHLMKTQKGDPRSPSVRLQFLEKLSKYPSLHAAIGALLFKEMLQKGRIDIGVGYFFRIMEGGAALKYRKLKHAEDSGRGADSLFKN